jgi:hypothetical protein
MFDLALRRGQRGQCLTLLRLRHPPFMLLFSSWPAGRLAGMLQGAVSRTTHQKSGASSGRLPFRAPQENKRL